MALSPGSITLGSRRSEMKRLNYQAGEMGICPRGMEVRFGNEGVQRLSLSLIFGILSGICIAKRGLNGHYETNLRGKSAGVILRQIEHRVSCNNPPHYF